MVQIIVFSLNISLGDESYLVKEIEFGFALPEKVEWKIVEFNEVPTNSIIIGDYIVSDFNTSL